MSLWEIILFEPSVARTQNCDSKSRFKTGDSNRVTGAGIEPARDFFLWPMRFVVFVLYTPNLRYFRVQLGVLEQQLTNSTTSTYPSFLPYHTSVHPPSHILRPCKAIMASSRKARRLAIRKYARDVAIFSPSLGWKIIHQGLRAARSDLAEGFSFGATELLVSREVERVSKGIPFETLPRSGRPKSALTSSDKKMIRRVFAGL